MAQISDITLARYERGENDPRLSTLVRWADALGYEIVLRAKTRE